ncbi:hypothetical protein VTO58DRAFT_106117 [Aureobasidium pullulans]
MDAYLSQTAFKLFEDMEEQLVWEAK